MSFFSNKNYYQYHIKYIVSNFVSRATKILSEKNRIYFLGLDKLNSDNRWRLNYSYNGTHWVGAIETTELVDYVESFLEYYG